MPSLIGTRCAAYLLASGAQLKTPGVEPDPGSAARVVRSYCNATDPRGGIFTTSMLALARTTSNDLVNWPALSACGAPRSGLTTTSPRRLHELSRPRP